jgi:cytidine deaminase
MDKNVLIKSAVEVKRHAYTPYSHFAVGAALLTKSGKVFTGCNVENLSFRLTVCAEEAAVAAAIAGGERDFTAIAVVADSKELAMPCGACRQVLAEFNPDIEVITATADGRKEGTFLLSDLLPRAKQGILESLRSV